MPSARSSAVIRRPGLVAGVAGSGIVWALLAGATTDRPLLGVAIAVGVGAPGTAWVERRRRSEWAALTSQLQASHPESVPSWDEQADRGPPA